MRAVFEGWLRPGSRTEVIAKGPFTVEVFETGKKAKPQYCARLLPTQERMFEVVSRINRKGQSVVSKEPLTRNDETQARGCVEFMFANKIQDWHEPVKEASA